MEEIIHVIFYEKNYQTKEESTCDVESIALVLNSKYEQDNGIHKGVPAIIE